MPDAEHLLYIRMDTLVNLMMGEANLSRTLGLG